MNNTSSTPDIFLGGGSGGMNAAAENNLGLLGIIYKNLISGAADVGSATGSKVLVLKSGDITSAEPWEAGLNETAAEVQSNYDTLQDIATYCKDNGISVEVDASLTNPATFSNGENAQVTQWANVAAEVGLPISAVEDVEEIGSSQSPTDFTTYAATEVNAVKTIIESYSSSTYHMTASNLSVGDMEGQPSSISDVTTYWNDYDAAAEAAGVPTFSFTTTDTNWFGPWITQLSEPNSEAYLESMSTAAAQNHMTLNVLVQGSQTEASSEQFVRQAEQNAAWLAQLQASGSIDVSTITVSSWQPLPLGAGMISSPTTQVNEAAEINATYALYSAGLITAQQPLGINAPGQIVMQTGTAQYVGSLSAQLALADVKAGNRMGIVLIDQTGTLHAVQHGAGTVSNTATNILVLTGTAADIDAELSSVTITEVNPGADTIDLETYGTAGRMSDDQISVLAAAPGQTVSNIPTTSNLQGWVDSSFTLNNGTVASNNSILTSETLYWNTTGTLQIGGTASGSSNTPAYTNVVSIHEPLAEYGVELAPGSALGTPAPAVADIYNAAVDWSQYTEGGYANNTGVNNVILGAATWLGNSFDAQANTMPLVVQSTINIYSPTSGQLESSINNLAPDPLTSVNLSGTYSDIFANAFTNGGTQVVEYNVGGNTGWNATWGDQFNSATLSYDGSGQLTELFLQGGTSAPSLTVDDVFDPVTGKLWEEFQTAAPPSESATQPYYAGTSSPYQPGYVTGPMYQTQFNTGDNPNWDYTDWGNSISSATEVWTDYFIMAAVSGFAVDLPNQFGGNLTNYPGQFVCGTELDIMYLPGNCDINLNNLGSVTLDLRDFASTLSGINAINAGGATGTVTITGLAAGGSTLVGGDDCSTISGYGKDTIVAGAGTTTINTGLGDSTISVTSVSGRTTLLGNGNTVVAAAESTLTVIGNNNSIFGSDVTISATANAANISVDGNNDTVTLASGTGIILSGTDDVLNFVSGGTLTLGTPGSSAIVNGTSVVVWGSAGDSITTTNYSDIVTAGPNSTVNLDGDGSVAGVSSYAGCTVNVGGQGNVVYGSGVNLFMNSQTCSVTVYGSGDTFSLTKGGSITISGASATQTATEVDTVDPSYAEISDGTTASLMGSGDTGALTNTSSGTDNVYSSSGTISLTNSQAQINGGGNTINLSGTNSVYLALTGGIWDYLIGSGADVSVNGAQSVIDGGGNSLDLLGTGDSVTLTGTSNDWDLIAASDSSMFINSAQSVVTGGGNSLDLIGVGDFVTLSGTSNDWDWMAASDSSMFINSAQSVVTGGGNSLDLIGTGDFVTLADTSDVWDWMEGANSSVIVNSGQSVVYGGGNSLDLIGTGDFVTLAGTENHWDWIIGSNSSMFISSAQSTVEGGGNSLDLVGTGDSVALVGTSGTADWVDASDSTISISAAQATVDGSGNTISLTGTATRVSVIGTNDTLTFLAGSTNVSVEEQNNTGGKEAFVFAAAFGQDAISGWASADMFQFSQSDFSSWTALQSHMSQSGTNVLISFNASDSVTLSNVTLSSLTSSHFSFV